jgi:hypothetical protein
MTSSMNGTRFPAKSVSLTLSNNWQLMPGQSEKQQKQQLASQVKPCEICVHNSEISLETLMFWYPYVCMYVCRKRSFVCGIFCTFHFPFTPGRRHHFLAVSLLFKIFTSKHL